MSVFRRPTIRQIFSSKTRWPGRMPFGQELGLISDSQTDHVLKTRRRPSPWTFPTQSPTMLPVFRSNCPVKNLTDHGFRLDAVARLACW
jgi:hypothetical protein